MTLEWDDALLLGNAEIDEQHRQIFRHLETLSLACSEGRGEEVLKELLKHLDEYVTRHFAHEEAFMAQNRYPRLAEQQAQHAHFRQMVGELREMDMEGMDAQQLSIHIYRRLISWFNQHIKRLDQDMVNYILSQQHY